MKLPVLVSCLAWGALAWAGDDPRPIPAVCLRCAAQTGKQEFLVFKMRAECLAAHDAAPASEPAE